MTRWLYLAVIALVAAGVTSCGSSPDDTLQEFAAALSGRDVETAAARTDDPDAARVALRAMFDGMGDKSTLRSTAELVDDKKVTGGVRYDWSAGNGHRTSYTSTVTLRQQNSEWRIAWGPSVLHPQLRAGQTFSYSDDMRYTTPVVDRAGQPVMTWQTVYLVNLDPGSVSSADALASALRPVEPSMTARTISRQVTANRKAPTTVIRLRERDFGTVKDSVTGIPGVTVSKQGALLSATRSLRSPAMSGLEDAWRTRITATAGWSVRLVNDDGSTAHIVAEAEPRPTPPLATGLDVGIQRQAQAAVDTERRPSMIVAIAPSTGDIVAVAQNSAADKSGAVALTGLYPPGSTFKTITTAAALSRGVAEPDSLLPCPGRATIEGRTIPNEDDFDLGEVALSEAFAQSCNTTMGTLANRLPADALPGMARLFGIGVDYVIPGVTTVTGSVPDADSPARRVENGIGQGTVTVSPFGLAVAEASLARGSTITPRLLSGTGERTTASEPSRPLPPEVVDELRSMMRRTVTSGTATSLRAIPGLGGKTGTAEYGDNRNPHGWFAGITGDLAFATLVVGGGSSDPALRVSGEFLRPLASD